MGGANDQGGDHGPEGALEAGRGRRSASRLFLSAVVLPIVLAGIAGAWIVWQIRGMSEAAEWIDESDRVIALARDAQRRIVDEELAFHHFLFTEDPSVLAPYHQSETEEDLVELERLVPNDPQQLTSLHQLQGLYRSWRQEADRTIAEPPPRKSAGTLRGRWAAADEMRSTADEIAAREKSTRLARTRRFESRTRAATIGAATLLALLAAAASLTSRRQINLIGALMRREREALDQAHEALRAKDVFLANLSHELRTPLTPILGWVTIARTRRLAGEALEKALASIEKNARAEAQLVDDVLDIGRINAGKLRISQEAVDPAAVVRAAIDVVALSARAKDISVDAAIASPLPMIVGDPSRLQQVVWNLLSNAVKFTPRGGRIEVRVDRAQASVHIRVADDGAGITPDFLPHVFEDFRQADASKTRAHGGLGIGLAIVRHLVELHGGEVQAESSGPGHGAVFTVTLPAANAG